MSVFPKTKSHLYVEFNSEICSGRPIIANTRTTVRSVVENYKLGMSIEEILQVLPHLTPAQLHGALSYYYDHKTEIEEDMRQNLEESCMKQYPPGKY